MADFAAAAIVSAAVLWLEQIAQEVQILRNDKWGIKVSAHGKLGIDTTSSKSGVRKTQTRCRDESKRDS